MELENFSLDDLYQLQTQVDREIKRRRLQGKKEVLQKIRAIAASGGYSLEELVQGGESGEVAKVGRVVPPKYRDPENAEQTWTGRGKRPRWVVGALQAGKSLDDLIIR